MQARRVFRFADDLTWGMCHSARKAGLPDEAEHHLVALADTEHVAAERVQPNCPGVGCTLLAPHPGPERRRVDVEQ